MPAKYPEEFKRDVVAVARSSGLSQHQIARDFGISTHSVQRWIKQADVDDGLTEGTTTDEHKELVALKRRNRVLEQEVEIPVAPRPTSPRTRSQNEALLTIMWGVEVVGR